MNTRESILVVDDDGDLRTALEFALASKYKVYVAGSAAQAQQIIDNNKVSLILMDIFMPGGDGVSLVEGLRNHPATAPLPVMLMTGQSEPGVRLRAFTAGADDFLEKPFRLEEVHARIESKLRRHSQIARSATQILLGDLQLDSEAVELFVKGERVPIGLVECRILTLLARQAGSPVRRTTLESCVRGNTKESTRALDVHILSLRRKLANSGVALRTIYGLGYQLDRKSAG